MNSDFLISDLLNLIGEMKKELEHDRICGH